MRLFDILSHCRDVSTPLGADGRGRTQIRDTAVVILEGTRTCKNERARTGSDGLSPGEHPIFDGVQGEGVDDADADDSPRRNGTGSSVLFFSLIGIKPGSYISPRPVVIFFRRSLKARLSSSSPGISDGLF